MLVEALDLLPGRIPSIPSFAVFAFAKEERMVLLLVMRSTSSVEFLCRISNHCQVHPLAHPAHF